MIETLNHYIDIAIRLLVLGLVSLGVLAIAFILIMGVMAAVNILISGVDEQR